MNKQLQSALSAVQNFITGDSTELDLTDTQDDQVRQAVAAELLSAMGRINEKLCASNDEHATPPELERERARLRKLFMERGYFDETVQDLRVGSSAGRVAAAQALGVVGSSRGTAHLIAAMFDNDLEVRRAAAEALKQIGDPTLSDVPLNGILSAEALPHEDPPAHPSLSKAQIDLSDESERSVLNVDVELAERSQLQSPVLNESGSSDEQVEKVTQVGTTDDVTATTEDEQLILQEYATRKIIEQHEQKLVELARMRVEAETEARRRAEREATIIAEAEARRVEEEQQIRTAGEAATRRRLQAAEALTAESVARQQAESDIHQFAEQDARLRLGTGNLRHTVEELVHRRRQLESTRREAAEASRLAEVNRARQEAETQHQNEVERLQQEEQKLRFAAEDKMRQRSEVEGFLRKAESEIVALTADRDRLVTDTEIQIKQLKDELEQMQAAETQRREEAERLRRDAENRKKAEEDQLSQQLEILAKLTDETAVRRSGATVATEKARLDAENLTAALARMKAAEEERGRLERERVQLEAVTHERVQSEQRRLDQARRRAAAEQARLEEEKRRYDEGEAKRLVALEDVHRQAEVEAKQHAERELQLHAEIDHLRIADAEARRRIEEAETGRRTAEQAYRLVAEKAQRLEAEAHAAALQEEQMLAKLDAVRREAADEAQSRSEKIKHIKAEIEEFRRLQDEERPLLEAAILQRTAAAARLQQMRDSYTEIPYGAVENGQTTGASFAASSPGVVRRGEEFDGVASSGNQSRPKMTGDDDLPPWEVSGEGALPLAIGDYLNSVDPYKRAAGVAELARTQGKEAFDSIASCFDDHAPQVRNAAARALSELEPARTVDFLNRAMERGSNERRRNIGSAIAGSGLAAEAIDNLAGENREETYSALSILFVMAKSGEVQPLVKAIEEHHNEEVGRAAIKLLTLSGRSEVAEAAAKKRLANSRD